MLSTIISGATQSARADAVAALRTSRDDILIHLQAEKTSITILQIHSLVQDLAITATKARTIWLEEANLLTVPAQNALLKTLEEPAQSTRFVLTLQNPQLLLPTILSRCSLQKISDDTSRAFAGTELAIIKEALSLTPGARVTLADSLGRQRDVLLTWTSDCLADLQSKMNQATSPQALIILANIAKHVHSTHQNLTTHVSPGLAMQNLFLSLPHTKE